MKKFTFLLFLTSLLFFPPSLHAQDVPGKTWAHNDLLDFSGWNSEGLEALQEYVIDSTLITGMVIVHEGKVILEYGNVEENSYIASCRKSILAMLYGPFVENGTIDLDKKLKDLDFIEKDRLLPSELEVSIRDIISSRSGTFLPASNRGDMLDQAPARGSQAPGEMWLYSNWDFNMAGHLFELITKSSIYEELERKFARPLQMQDWDRSLQKKSGDPMASRIEAYHMWFSTRDMARLGLLMLNEGRWGEQQILSPEWVQESTTEKSSFEEVNRYASFMNKSGGHYSYGYMWWLWDTPEHPTLKGAYAANGAWGQNLTILPAMNAVISIKTNANYGRRKGGPSSFNYIARELGKMYNSEIAKAHRSWVDLLEAGEVAQFVKAFKKSDQLDYATVLNTIGYKYMAEKDYKNALLLFALNTKTYPESWNGYDSMGEALFRNGEYDKSLVQFKKAVELNTTNQYGNNDRLAMVIKDLERGIED